MSFPCLSKYLMFGYDRFPQNRFQSFMHYHQMSIHLTVYAGSEFNKPQTD